MVYQTVPGRDTFHELKRHPVDETPAQKAARRKLEANAQRLSNAIEQELKQERAAKKEKEERITKVLLLGQSDSGKSTLLKYFRMKYDRAKWDKERNGWRAVVQLTVVRAICDILKVIEAESNGNVPANSEVNLTLLFDSPNETEAMKTTDISQLISRLATLYGVEAELKRQLGTGLDVPEGLTMPLKEVLAPAESSSTGCDTATTTFANCKEDMKAIWENKTVQLMVKKQRLQLHESAGYFLRDLDRVASHNFVPTDSDIVQAHVRTVGIQEHRLVINDSGNMSPGWEWSIFDVGGYRTVRKAWPSYFDDVNTIIFVCPVSVFDERLEEDRRVNRLEDSLLIWTEICRNNLLTKTQLILFLSKCDLLQEKLERGVKVKDYVPSYGDRPNTVSDVVKYLRDQFKAIPNQYSPKHRTIDILPTTVTDTTATQITQVVKAVFDGIVRGNLEDKHLI